MRERIKDIDRLQHIAEWKDLPILKQQVNGYIAELQNGRDE